MQKDNFQEDRMKYADVIADDVERDDNEKMIAEDEVKAIMVENDDAEKKKKDEVESYNVEAEDELNDKLAERKEKDADDVAKDRAEHVMLRIVMSKLMMSKGRVACCKAGPCDVHRRPRRRDVPTCTDDRFQNDQKRLRHCDARPYNVHRRPTLTCTDDRF